MDTGEPFLASDTALRSVIDRIDTTDLRRPVPQEWHRTTDPVLRDVLRSHADDEAWVLEGRSAADGDELRDADLLGDDAVGAYDALYDAATAAVLRSMHPDAVFRFQYGDSRATEGPAHLATCRAFQAWPIARHLDMPFQLSPELVPGMEEDVLPRAASPSTQHRGDHEDVRDRSPGEGHRQDLTSPDGRRRPTTPCRVAGRNVS